MKSVHWFLISFILALIALVLSLSGGESQPATQTPSRVPGGALSAPASSYSGVLRPSSSLAALLAPPQVADLVRVVDGDTLILRVEGKQESVRIVGINAPEVKTHACYADLATRRLKELTSSGAITVRAKLDGNRDVFGRLLRYVYVNDEDVGLRLVAEGLALSYEKYPHPELAVYEAQEAQAHAQRVGLWGTCPSPASSSSPSGSVASSGSGCVIKGNINPQGKKLYHLPTCRGYSATHIEESKGERWFCTEAQAQAAGWVRAGGCP